MAGEMGPSLEERGIKKENLSLRDRVMAMKGEDHLDNLGKALGAVGLVEKAVRQLERVVEAFKDESLEIQQIVQKEVDQLEQFIQQAERGEIVDPKAVKIWEARVKGLTGGIPSLSRKDMERLPLSELPRGGMHS